MHALCDTTFFSELPDIGRNHSGLKLCKKSLVAAGSTISFLKAQNSQLLEHLDVPEVSKNSKNTVFVSEQLAEAIAESTTARQNALKCYCRGEDCTRIVIRELAQISGYKTNWTKSEAMPLYNNC